MGIDKVLAKFPNAKKTGDGWIARCPAHDDHNPSLSIWVDDKKKVGLNCHAGCHHSAVLAAAGLTESDLYEDPPRKPKGGDGRLKGRIIAEYKYFTKDGKPIVCVVRKEPKAFLRMSPDGDGGWKWGGTCGAAALYRWPELAEAVSAGRTVFLVEGEKDVENMVKAGAVATTCLGGASKWRPELAKEFKGAQRVCIIADRDSGDNKFEGQRFALAERAAIRAEGVEACAVCLPPEVNGHKVKDASDALAAGWTLDDIIAHCEAAKEVDAEFPLVDAAKKSSSSASDSGAGRQGRLFDDGVAKNADPDADPADEPTLREAVALAIEQAVYYDSRGHAHPARAEERRAAVKRHGVEWMLRHGGFFRDSERTGTASLYFYESSTRRLYSMENGSEPFTYWLGWASGLDQISNEFRTLLAACREAAMYDPRSIEVSPSLFWEYRDGRIYVSNGDGEMARIDEAGVSIVENGTDGVLFRMGRTLAPWALLPEEEGVPMHSMRLVGGISTPENPLAPLLLLLWILALPRNLKNKPPLSLCGEVGSGKTRSARGIYEMLGMVERVSSADKSEKGEEQFWVSVGYGGISTIDNVDSKIKWLADAVAGSSTGAQKERRTLYTDSDLTFLRSRSAVILTSANSNYATDAGLADRLVSVVFARPPSRQATSDGELSEEIAAARDGLMTWLCWTLSRALRVKETPPAALNRRHPDWSEWCWRCGVALGYRAETEAALNRAEADKPRIAILSDEYIGAVLYRVFSELGEPWEGTASELRQLVLKGGGNEAGHRPGSLTVFAEKSVTPEEYSGRALEEFTVRKIGTTIGKNQRNYEAVFGVSKRISAGNTLWRFEPPGRRVVDVVDVDTPFLTFIKKNFPHGKEENRGSTSTTATNDPPPADEPITDPADAPFL